MPRLARGEGAPRHRANFFQYKQGLSVWSILVSVIASVGGTQKLALKVSFTVHFRTGAGHINQHISECVSAAEIIDDEDDIEW